MKLQHCCWWTGRKKAAMAGASAANAEPVLPGCALIRKVFLVSPPDRRKEDYMRYETSCGSGLRRP